MDNILQIFLWKLIQGCTKPQDLSKVHSITQTFRHVQTTACTLKVEVEIVTPTLCLFSYLKSINLALYPDILSTTAQPAVQDLIMNEALFALDNQHIKHIL